jgi:hypothetical protein
MGGPAVPPFPLPAPSGPIVRVHTLAQLQNAVAGIASNTTILIGPGTYNLAAPLYINGTFTNVGIRGATGNRDDVVLVGKGMNGATDGGVPFGIWVGGNVQGVTIAHLTIRDVYYHPIMLNAGAQSPLIHNVRLVNAGQQLLKSSPDGAGGGVDNGIVEYSVFEYDTTSRDDYTNGVDVHTGDNWIIRHNLFRNIRAPQGQLAGPAILMWNHSPIPWSMATRSRLPARDSPRLIERTPNDHWADHQEQLHLPPGAGDSAIYAADPAQHPGSAQLDFRHGRQPDRALFSSRQARIPTLDGRVQARDGAAGSAW